MIINESNGSPPGVGENTEEGHGQICLAIIFQMAKPAIWKCLQIGNINMAMCEMAPTKYS